jgi:uncharacterized Tic20 family protein
MNAKIKAAWSAARVSARRDLGIFFVMMILALVAALIAVPIILILTMLSDWAWGAVAVAFVVWIIFGETITATVRAYRGEKP